MSAAVYAASVAGLAHGHGDERARASAHRAAAFIGLVLLLGACTQRSTPTQTIVSIDVDDGVRAELVSLRLQLDGDEDPVYGQTLRKPSFPVKLVVAPRNEDPNRGFRLVAEARDEAGKPFVQSDLRSGFVDGQARFVRLLLATSCKAKSSIIDQPPERFGRTLERAAKFTTCVPGDPLDQPDPPAEPPQSIPDAGPDAAEGGSLPDPEPASQPPVVSEQGDDDGGALPGGPETCPAGASPNDRGECPTSPNPCAFDNGGCERRCVMLDNRPRCQCDPGGSLRADGQTCQEWNRPVKIQTDTQQSGRYPRLAMSARGHAVAAWVQADRIGWNEFRPGVGWQTQPAPGPVVSPDAFADGLQLAMDAQGRAVAVWGERNTSETRWASELNGERGWAAPTPVEGESPTFSSSAASLAMNAKGTAMTAWGTTLNGASTAWVRSVAPAASWSMPVALGALAVDSPAYDSIGVTLDPNDNGLAVFRGPPDATKESVGVWASTISPQLMASAATRIDVPDLTRRTPENPRVAFDPLGRAIAIWSQETLYANRFEDGQWTGEVPLQAWNRAGAWASEARLASDELGNFIVAWTESLGPDVSIWAARYSVASSRWEMAVSVERDSMGFSSTPRVAAGANGQFIVVWARTSTGRTSIWANRFTPQLGWSGAVKLESDDTGDAVTPDIAMDAEGNAIAIWSQTNAAYDHVWASRFD